MKLRPVVLGILFLATAFCRAQNTTTFGNIVSQGMPCGASNCVYYQLPPATHWVSVVVTGTWSGTLEMATTSAPNANYSNLDTLAWTAVATEAANGTWTVATTGSTYLRVRATSWTGGAGSLARVAMDSTLSQAPLTNPIFPGTLTASGLAAQGGGTSSSCWATNGTAQTCGGLGATPTFALATDPQGNINPTGVISSYYGTRFVGDSNTACYQFASSDASHCATYAVGLAETGSPTGAINSGYGGMSMLDATWFLEMYANVNPTVTGNPIDHLSVGTNTVRFLAPNTPPPAAWLTAANQEMYELAIHETTVPQEKYLPNDPIYAASTGSWTPTFNFTAVAGPIIAGCGYTPADVLNITGTGFNMMVDTVGNSGCAGAIAASHVSTFPTPPYSVPVPPLPTTGGTGTGATYDPLYLNTTNYTYISTGSTDSITYSNVLVEQNCVFLNYEVWPLPGNPGGQTGSIFSVFADGSGAPMTDSLTGLTTISSNVSALEPQPEPVNNRLGGYNGWKVAKLCGLTSGTHSFVINKVSPGYEGIQYLAAPRATLDQGSDGPNLNVIGILPIYPNATNGFTAAIATYNQQYSAMVHDLASNFGRRIVYTDMSSVDMNQPYYIAIGNQFWGHPQTCGISGGVVTMTEVYNTGDSPNLPSTGQVLEASNLSNCGVANGVLLVVQSVSGSTSLATLTLTPEFPFSLSGAAVANSTITVAAEPATSVTELTMNGWIVNASSTGTGVGQLHMPQNAQMDAARRIENADRTAPGLPGTGGQWITSGQNKTGRYVSIFTDLSSPGTTNAIGSTITSSSVLTEAAPSTTGSPGGIQFCQYAPVANINPGTSRSNYACYAELTNFRFNLLANGLATPTSNKSSATVDFLSTAYSDGVFLLSQTAGTGATGTGTCALSGGTFTHAGTCIANLNGSGGVNATITNPGDYTVLPTVVITGFGSLTGYSATTAFNNYLVINSQNPGSGYTNPSCSISGGTFLVAATCTAAVNINSGAVATITTANGGSYSSLVGATLTITDPTGSGFSALLGTHSINETYAMGSVFVGNAPVQSYLQLSQNSQAATSGTHGVRLNAVNNAGYTFNFAGCTACMATFDDSAITLPHTYTLPDQSGILLVTMARTLTTTAATSDAVSISGATTSSHCSLAATNASAATNIATTYISAKAANSVTVTHVATAGMTYDVTCTPN